MTIMGVMNSATSITTDSETSTMTIEVDGSKLTYSPSTDDRVIGVEDDKVLTRSATSALELASEMRAWGVRDARGHGCAVVFWG